VNKRSIRGTRIMTVFKGWICDTCGEQIEKPSDGWVEWINYKDENGQWKGRDLRLVHCRSASPRNYGCQFNRGEEFQEDGGVIGDSGLEMFQGPDGLMILLAKLEEQKLPMSEVIEMIKRLHIPDYEYARLYVEEAIAEGVIEPDMPKGYYWQHEIQATLRFAKERQSH
jgi:hypothetical protein